MWVHIIYLYLPHDWLATSSGCYLASCPCRICQDRPALIRDPNNVVHYGKWVLLFFCVCVFFYDCQSVTSYWKSSLCLLEKYLMQNWVKRVDFCLAQTNMVFIFCVCVFSFRQIARSLSALLRPSWSSEWGLSPPLAPFPPNGSLRQRNGLGEGLALVVPIWMRKVSGT